LYVLAVPESPELPSTVTPLAWASWLMHQSRSPVRRNLATKRDRKAAPFRIPTDSTGCYDLGC
jgi:hypothetical protein